MSNWYKQINSNDILEQGDFIYECPIINPPSNINFEEWSEQGYSVNLYNVIILTQSCDLANKKIVLVQVCPFFTLEEFCKHNSNFDNPKSKETIRRGYLPGYHLLDKCKFHSSDDYLIIDFKNTYSVSFDFLEKYKTNTEMRIRLESPYKEHLSQSYARFFMRVGLPSSIPSFRKK